VILRLLFLLTLLTATAAQADVVGYQILEEMNLARTQPQRYAQIVAARVENYRDAAGIRAGREAVSFLQKAKALPPLVWSRGISQAALSHALDVGSRGGSGHRSSRGETPWQRMSRFGQYQGYAGENIDYGNGDARSIVVSLIVDRGVSSRMHRTNIFSRNFRVTGIAVAPHARAGTMCVMDFASSFVEAGEERVATRGGALRSEYSGMSFF
jgi:uncharacterized protein YkwD